MVTLTVPLLPLTVHESERDDGSVAYDSLLPACVTQVGSISTGSTEDTITRFDCKIFGGTATVCGAGSYCCGAGTGLDVFEEEPLPVKSPLRALDNVLLTPHIAFLTKESMDECTFIPVRNIELFAAGQPENVVNPAVLGDMKQM